MRKIAFTICAKNYIGLAQTLGNSITKHNKDVLFFIFIADELLPEEDFANLSDNIIVAKNVVDIPQDEWYQMCFKYDITEFCTSIKPSCFKYIFEFYKPDKCIYFDPDILVFNSLDSIYKKLDQYSIVLTPHITSIEDFYTGNLNEQNLLFSGMYNLGFLALKVDDTSMKMLNWWKVRLKDRCYQNKMENYFTDQKWMDFLPSFFPNQLLISSDLGLNFAPWNYYEREIISKHSTLYVKSRIYKESFITYPLIFVHFSGYNYAALLESEFAQRNIDNLEVHSDINVVFEQYRTSLLLSDFSKYINVPYSYSSFSNKTHISIVYRRLFRRLLEDGCIDSNPFDSNGQFYQSLKKGGLIKEQMLKSDKSSISNIEDAHTKTVFINKVLFCIFKVIGAEKFFLITRLMRLYSKHENHVYLIDKRYLKNFKIRN